MMVNFYILYLYYIPYFTTNIVHPFLSIDSPIVESAHSANQSNGHHMDRASDEIVDITDDEDEANEDDEDSEQRYVSDL